MQPDVAAGSECVPPLDQYYRVTPLDVAECGTFHNGCGPWYTAGVVPENPNPRDIQPWLRPYVLLCGSCDGYNRPAVGITNFTCGGGGEPYGRCGCTPDTCGDRVCGSFPDGCGGTLECGTCGGGRECNDRGECCTLTQGQMCGFETPPGSDRPVVNQCPPRCGTWTSSRDSCSGVEFDCGEPPAGFVCNDSDGDGDGFWGCPGGGLGCVSDEWVAQQCARRPDGTLPPTYYNPLTCTATLCIR
jgi:hypothetical protein